MKTSRKSSCGKVILFAVSVLLGVCLTLTAGSALINSRRPTQSPVVDRLTEADKARLAEAYHLREALGEELIPGWASAEIPLILYNEQYAFLVGDAQPADGWEKVPNGPRRGGAWQVVPDDTFQGRPYYRQTYPAGQEPESFTVRVGERWAASLTTLDWFKIRLADYMRADLPTALQPIFPYGLVVNFTMGSSDQYMSLIQHESAHAYQGLRAPEKLAAAERASLALDDRYPYQDEAFAAAWQAELDCLRDALRAESDADARAQALRFLELRRSRRQSASLATELIDLERGREWEEGFAKYVEMTSYRLAAETPGYTPVPELANDAQFQQYRGFSALRQREIDQIATSGRQRDEIRFYYSGWAQAELLDRLSPGWKARLFEDGVWLEDLLDIALATA